MLARLERAGVPDRRPPVVPQVHISYGQSWRSNAYPSFSGFGLNPQPQTLLALKTSSIGAPTFAPGPLPNSAGIALTGTIIGLTNYQGSDYVTIGRCAVQAQQLLRVWRGLLPLQPILEFCAAYPGSTWFTGNGGGLSPGAGFTASIVDGTMTVTAVSSRQLSQMQTLHGTGIPAGVYVLGGPNPGTTGTYNVATATVVTPQTIQTAGGAVFTGQIGTAVPSDQMVVSSISAGSITVGDTITVPASLSPTKIRAQLSGTAGGVGTYQVYVLGVTVNTPSQAFTTTTTSWTNQAAIINAIESVLPISGMLEARLSAEGLLHPPDVLPEPLDPADFDQYDAEERLVAIALAEAPQPDPDLEMAVQDIVGQEPKGGYASAIFRSVGYTQGTAADNTQASKLSDLTDMLTLYDGMGLPGTGSTPLNYYLGLPAEVSNLGVFSDSYQGTTVFCRTNAPGRGGPWSGRCFATSPSYPWQFVGTDNIHTGDYGTVRWGEWEGYVKHLVEDLGVGWTPLWRSFVNAIYRIGQNIHVPFDRPTGPDFATGVLAWKSDPVDGIKVWPQYGFYVWRSGVSLSLGTPMISGLEVIIPVFDVLNAGDALEVSAAYYGPGGPNPGLNSGVGCNLMMAGPPSQLVPGKTIDAWVWPFKETVTI